ncbi:MAG TPA: hypothetical protein VE377_00555 [Candidatus Dormibacteraeota bacterium]|nr:hypothetical protein [Candidatus Dormibacteraeota bacterium]
MRRNSDAGKPGWVQAFMATLLTLVFLAGCSTVRDKDNEEGGRGLAKKETAQVSIEKGQTILTLDPSTQARLGLETATLTAAVTRAQEVAPAVVLSVQDLATSRKTYVAARTQLDKARVQTEVARQEYTRLKALFEQNQNISQKSLQSMEGVLRADEMDEGSAQQQLKLQESVIRQEWGSVTAKWVVDGSPELERVLDQREALVQVTVPRNESFAVPKAISLDMSGGTRTDASLVSTFPRVDPRIQGRSYLYRTRSQAGLAPGTNLVAHLSVGSSMKGVIMPESAVVWSEGKAWVYLESAKDRFTRRAVATDIPVEAGFFVTQGFSPGGKVVSQGAQSLLSEELLSGGHAGAMGDED